PQIREGGHETILPVPRMPFTISRPANAAKVDASHNFGEPSPVRGRVTCPTRRNPAPNGARLARANGLSQPRLWPHLKIAHFQLHRAIALPLVELRRKDQAALSGRPHQFRNALAHAEGDGAE